MNSLRKQLVKTVRTVSNLQNQSGRQCYSQYLKKNAQTLQFQQFSNKMRFNFCQEKEQKSEEKAEEKTEEQAEVKKEESKNVELPDDFNKLLELGTREAITKAKTMYKKLDDTIFDQKKDISKAEKQVELTEKSNQDLLKKIDKLRGGIKQMEEDIEGVRKRLTKEKEDEKVFGVSKFAKEMLETADNLERAIDNSKENKEFQTLFEGTEMTYKILMGSLKKFKVTQLNPFKEKFDPNRMDALMQVDDPNLEPGTVAFVVQSGFMIGERCLRPAKVGIVKDRPQEQQQQAQEETKQE